VGRQKSLLLWGIGADVDFSYLFIGVLEFTCLIKGVLEFTCLIERESVRNNLISIKGKKLDIITTLLPQVGDLDPLH